MRQTGIYERFFVASSFERSAADDSFTGQVKVCVELEGIDVNSTEIQGTTALHIAAGKGNVKLASYLISVGADRFAQDCNGLAPIHCAARNGHLEIIKLILESDGYLSEDFDMKTYDGWTMLHFACRDGHSALFDYLMLIVKTTLDSVMMRMAPFDL